MTSEEEDGILPTLRTAEETLQRVQHKQDCVARLLDLQGRYRYVHTWVGGRIGGQDSLWSACLFLPCSPKPTAAQPQPNPPTHSKPNRQDVSKLRERVHQLYEQAAEEEASHTDTKRQEIHDRSKAVFEGVKALKERVKAAQGAYRQVGISTAAGGGGGGVGGGGGGVTVHEEKLSELRGQIRGLAGRLHRVQYAVEEEEREKEEEGGQRKNDREMDSDEEDEGNRPPTVAYTE